MESRKRKRVLFICYGNRCRSPMAEAFLRAYGGQNFEPLSAGIIPSDSVSEKAVEVMKEKGIDISSHKPRLLHDVLKRYDRFDAIVIMDTNIPIPFSPADNVVFWNIPDPWGASVHRYRKVRNLIERNVLELIKKIND